MDADRSVGHHRMQEVGEEARNLELVGGVLNPAEVEPVVPGGNEQHRRVEWPVGLAQADKEIAQEIEGYLDYEQGSAETARRFAALGATIDLLSKRLVYREFPGAPDWDALGALWDEHPDAVGVWDSTRGILRTLGLDEDRAAEVGRFMDPLVEFTLSRGIATLLIDHVAKAATDSTGYARGSGDKLAAVQAQWFVKKARAFDETEAGEIELVRWKARSGALNRLHRFAVGDGQGALTFARLDPDKSPEGRAEAAIIDYLKAGHPVTYSLREIEGHVSGRAADTRGRVRALAEDAQRPVASVEEAGHTRYAYVPDADQEPQEADALSF